MTDPQRVTEWFRNRIGEVDTVWDVGAHDGDYTDLALQSGAESVALFEPRDAARCRLRGRFADDPVGVFRCALFDRTTRGFLEEGMGGPSTTCFVPDPRGDVYAFTADEMAEDIGYPDVLKIDVEGAEVRVLRGAYWTLQNAKAVLVEVHAAPVASTSPEDYGDDPDEAEGRLELSGFSTERIGKRSDPVYHLLAVR